MTTTFIGIDASWKSGNPSGIAIARGTKYDATLLALIYKDTHAGVAAVVREFRSENTVVTIDAPLIATNPLGTSRDCERGIGREFARFHAAAHVMNRPKFDLYGLGRLVESLTELGFVSRRRGQTYPYRRPTDV